MRTLVVTLLIIGVFVSSVGAQEGKWNLTATNKCKLGFVDPAARFPPSEVHIAKAKDIATTVAGLGSFNGISLTSSDLVMYIVGNDNGVPCIATYTFGGPSVHVDGEFNRDGTTIALNLFAPPIDGVLVNGSTIGCQFEGIGNRNPSKLTIKGTLLCFAGSDGGVNTIAGCQTTVKGTRTGDAVIPTTTCPFP